MSAGIFGFNERMQNIIGSDDLLEGRFENNADFNPIYVGYTPIPNGSIDDPIWYIMKIDYDGTGIVRKRIANTAPNTQAFTYIWSQRATYFS